MLKTVFMSAAALAILGGIAFAQTATPNPPQPQNDQTVQDGPGDQGGWWGKRHHGMRGSGGPGGPGMMGMMRGTGFKLHLGKDVDVAIMCGQEAMKDCIASAQPLIDAAKAAAAKTQ